MRIIGQKFLILSLVVGPLFGFSDVASFIATVLMVITGIPLTPVKVFMLLAFTKALVLSFAYRAGLGLQSLAEAKVSLSRIQAFLTLPNLPQFRESSNTQQECFGHQSVGAQPTSTSEVEVRYSRGIRRQKRNRDTMQSNLNTFDVANEDLHKNCIVANLKITMGQDRNIIDDVSFKVPQKGLVVLTGPVGSGKSTILAAINGEVATSAGSVICPGTIEHVSQTSWIFSGTILENILFGKGYDEERLSAVIDACAMTRDLEIFPDGPQTIVGEHGAVLSGGQQSRVSLARAVYADAAVYLLDDPLSAVDTNVAEHIFDKCICGLLATKTRLLVTHRTSHMQAADEIVLLSKGQVLANGGYAEMVETGLLDRALKDYENSPDYETLECKPARLFGAGVATGLEIPDEDRQIGTLSLTHYWQYFRAGQSTLSIVGLVLVFFITQGER